MFPPKKNPWDKTNLIRSVLLKNYFELVIRFITVPLKTDVQSIKLKAEAHRRKTTIHTVCFEWLDGVNEASDSRPLYL